MNRPTLLSIGIICNALHALLLLLVLAILSMAVLGVGAFAGLSGPMSSLPIAGLIATMGMLLIVPVFLFYLLVLASCWGSWNGERGWTWTLIILSVLGLMNSGPLSIVIGLCAVIGGLQALGVIGGNETSTG
ncbi:MAG TPA: hypothetical protein EYQ74_09885 [Planctomycetes bacterium]|nr:hypothetical protein [Planctomycetota bacterium]HIK60794.1 hypothetical protein [Planctomycetota bacterium]